MVDMIFREKLTALNTSDVFEFGMSKISRCHDDEMFYNSEVFIFRNGTQISRFSVTSIGEFGVLRGGLSYIGSTLRGISRDKAIEFDLSGLSFDEYLPLSKSQRVFWEE